MKRIIFISVFLFAILVVACNNTSKNEAQQTANAIENTTKTFGPPQIATSDNGYFMKATVNGKSWVAKSMMEINESNSEFIRGDDGHTQIAFYIDRDHIKVGKSRKFYLGHSADLSIGVNLMSAQSGEWIITKADNDVIEGTFHFSAKSSIDGTTGKYKTVCSELFYPINKEQI